MNAVMTWLAGATVLWAAALAVDAMFARQRPLAVSALWNAVLVAALALGPAAWLLPRWELAVLPAQPSRMRAIEAPGPASLREEVIVESPPPVPQSLELPAEALVPAPRREAFAPPTPPTWSGRWRSQNADLGAVLAAFYAFGVTLMLLRLAANLVAVGRLRRQARPLEAAAWLARLEHWRRKVVPRRSIALLASDKVSAPIVLGWRRSAIVIPIALVDEPDTKIVDAILVHELAHVERADCGWQLVERLVQAVYWFHPLVWLAGRRIAAVRERACDDFAIHALADRNSYAETLLEMASRLTGRRPLGLAMAVVRRSRLERRLEAIEHSVGHSRCQTGRPTAVAITSLLLAAVAGGLTLRVVRAEEPADVTPHLKAPASAVEANVTSAPTADTPPMRTRIDMRTTLQKWIGLLELKDYAAFAESFDAPLKTLLPPARLAEIFTELTTDYGTLRNIRDKWKIRRYGLEWFDIVTPQFERAELELRLIVDKQSGVISALWIAPFEGPEAPSGFDRARYAFGMAAEQAARAELSLSAEAVDANDRPTHAQFRFFAALEPDDPRVRPTDWFDAQTSIVWQDVTNGGDGERHLPPGRYRVTAHAAPRGNGSHHAPFAMSDVVQLEAGQAPAVVRVRFVPGSTLVVRAVDADTGQAVDDVWLTLKRADHDFPPNWQGLPTSVERLPGVYTFDDLPAGPYVLSGGKFARSPTDVRRKLVEPRVLVEMRPGQNQDLEVAFRAARLDEAEIAKAWPWVATGRVTDPAGKPIAGATVRIATGLMTLLGGGSTSTNADGRYLLRFAQGIGTSDPVALQAACISADKPGYFETNLNRQGSLAMALRQPEAKYLQRWNAKFAFLPHEPREVNFTLARAAAIRVRLVDARDEAIAGARVSLVGEQSPGGSAVSPGTTSNGGRAAFETPLNFKWSFAATAEKTLSGRSQAFELTAAGDYNVTLRLRREQTQDVSVLDVVEFLRDGRDVKAEVLRDDPLTRSPLEGEPLKEAFEILHRVRAANRAWWFERPPETVERIGYDFLLRGERQSFAYEKAKRPFDHWVAHALSYSPAAAMLCAAPQRATIRMLDAGPEEIRIAYTAKEHLGYSGGNGVGGTWFKFRSGQTREGILTLDAKRMTPLEHQFNGNARETFSDYMQLPDGTWAPRRVRVSYDGNPYFDWKFDVYEPGVWLFSKSLNVDEPEGEPIATVENVTINGQPARRLP